MPDYVAPTFVDDAPPALNAATMNALADAAEQAHARLTAVETTRYTDEQARDAAATMLTTPSHTGISFVHDDVANTVTATVTVPGYTDEQAQDAAAAAFAAGTHTGVEFVYDDTTGALSATVTATNGVTQEQFDAGLADKAPAGHWHTAPATASPALTRLRVALATRDSGPRPLVYCGSSTTAGSNATAESRRYVNVLTAALQAEFPLRTGTASPAMRTLAQAVGAALTAGVQGVNAGVGGTTAANYLTTTTITDVASLDPVMILHMVGSNDYASGVAPATYKSNLLAKIDALDAQIGVPHVHILVQPYQRTDVTNPTYPWSAYRDAMAELAAAAPSTRALIDLDPIYTTAGVPGADGYNLLDTDNVHQTDAGHTVMADLIVDALTIDVTIPVAETVADTVAPSVPTNLAATPGNTQVALTWTGSTDNVGVSVYRVRRGGVLVASPTSASHTDTGLTNGTTYTYTVSAVDAAGNESAQTAAVTATPANTGPTVTLSDPFDRANSTTTMGTAPTGQVWSPQTGTWGISANRAYNTSTGASVTTLIDTGLVDVDATCIINHASGTYLPGLVVRGLNDANRLGGYINASGDQVVLYKSDAGATSIITQAAMTVDYGVDYTVRILAVGTSIRVFVGGTERITHTLAGGDATKFTDPTYTRVGFRGNSETRWDDLTVYPA